MEYNKYLDGIDLENVDIPSILMKPMTLKEICETLGITKVYQHGYRRRQLDAINKIFVVRRWKDGRYVLTKFRKDYDKPKIREKFYNDDPRFQIPYKYGHQGGGYAITVNDEIIYEGKTNDYRRMFREILAGKCEGLIYLNMKNSAFISTEEKYADKKRKK